MPTGITEHGRRLRESAALLRRFEARIQLHPELDRTLVSFQGNRRQPFFSWFQFREGFSAALARNVIDRSSRRGEVLLDPFAGVGTSLFAAQHLGRGAIGIELLPVGVFVIEARLAADQVCPTEFRQRVADVSGADWSRLDDPEHRIRHVLITDGAFSEPTEQALAGYRAYCERELRDENVRRLFHLAALAVLESVSYTRKDGQYLRWDTRAPRGHARSKFRKGRIADFNVAVRRKLEQIADHLEGSGLFSRPPRRPEPPPPDSRPLLRQGSCLDLLPEMPDASVELVLTSPPYCNRYDYTRTYALELVYLGLEEDAIKALRQSMLSCTVENRAKTQELSRQYTRRGQEALFERARRVFEEQAALQEILALLEEQARAGRLTNPRIPRLVRNYFFEMSIVVAELARVIRPGGRIVMVNDNVRYAGMEVPVDLILSALAAGLGFEVEHIWTLARGKGNSSQQMSAHGREELRKCVYVWRG